MGDEVEEERESEGQGKGEGEMIEREKQVVGEDNAAAHCAKCLPGDTWCGPKRVTGL